MALDGWLKQSTAVTVKIGPFVDSVDGNTDEPGLTISQADVRLSKNGGNIAQKNEATSCAYDEIGYYDCPLDATDTGTLGILKVMVHETGALHVTHTYMIVPANVWDSLFGADLLQIDMTQIAGAAVSTTTAQVGANVVQVSGDGPAADNLEAACDGGTYNVGGGAVVAASVTGAVGSVTGAVGSVTGAVGSVTGAVGSVTGAVGSVTGAVGSVTGAVGSVAGNVDGNVTGSIGSLAAQAKADVNAEVDTALNTAIPGSPTANSVNERIVALDDHMTADYGTTEKAAIDLLDDVSGGLADIHTDVAAVKTDTAAILLDTGTTLDTKIDTIDDFLDTEIAAIKAKTDLIPASPAAVGSAMTLADGAITAAVIATGAIDADAIAADALGSSELAATAVTEIAAGIRGTGAITWTFLVTVGGNPVEGVNLEVATDAAKSNVIASGVTNVNGQLVCYLDAATYYVFATLAGYNFTNPSTVAVA